MNIENQVVVAINDYGTFTDPYELANAYYGNLNGLVIFKSGMIFSPTTCKISVYVLGGVDYIYMSDKWDNEIQGIQKTRTYEFDLNSTEYVYLEANATMRVESSCLDRPTQFDFTN